MDTLTFFGLIAVSAMLVTYALENISHWFVLSFAIACGFASLYGFLQGAWPFGLVEIVWAGVAYIRWRRRRQQETANASGLKDVPAPQND